MAVLNPIAPGAELRAIWHEDSVVKLKKED